MKIDDVLYFAPGIRFDEVDLKGPYLPEQFQARIEGYYLTPADQCAAAGAAFAAGVLVLTSIDALARVQFGGSVATRYQTFVTHEMAGLWDAHMAKRLYNDFRNGLIHEARIKRGAQFSLEIGHSVTDLDGILIVNPKLLTSEVRQALIQYTARLKREPKAQDRLSTTLMRDHALSR